MLLKARPQQLPRHRPSVRPCLCCQPSPGSLRRGFSARPPPPPSPPPYESTLGNLRIGRHTRVIFQGFTGRQATANARESLAWGTNIVGGVTPGREGEHLGLPLLPSVRAAVEALRPDATGIYVPAALAPAAIEEAVEAQVPLVVAVAEHIPLHAMLRIHAMLRTQSATRLVGANSPGIISAAGRCRIGFQPLPCFAPGRVGIAARSGTLSYEAVASTTRAGLGQSLCIGVGGDVVAGTDLREGLAVLAQDPDTDAIALIGEVGGASELEAAAWIEDYHRREPHPKPIVALVAGTHAVGGRVMGHAGAFTLPGEPTPQEKIDALRRAGATIIDHPEKFGEALKARLEAKAAGGGIGASSSSGLFSQLGATQRRGMHTSRRLTTTTTRPTLRSTTTTTTTTLRSQQKRSIYLGEEASFDLLRNHGITAPAVPSPSDNSGVPQRYLAISIDRASKGPCVLASPDVRGARAGAETISALAGNRVRRFPFDYRAGVDGALADRVGDHLQMYAAPPLLALLQALYAAFLAQEAFLAEVVVDAPSIEVAQARLGLDDVAFARRQRDGDADALRAAATEAARTRASSAADPAEAQARAGGIVYVTLGKEEEAGRSIGTLVNGAGLALNTVDALAGLGGQAANFLDTGGKATSETVRTCFEVLLRDPRVRVILVNVFGGLTLGDMIARGVLLAFRETKVTVPVVVRIRGTNEAEGQAIIRDSGLPLFAYDSFEEAAAKTIELARADSS